MALKVVLLGDSAVGKSSLLRRFTTDTFDPHSPNTIGAAFVSTDHAVENRNLHLEIWDTAGQERYRSLTPMYYRNGKVALVCFDMSAASTSFERARYWLDQLKLSGPADIAIKLVGTKADLVDIEEDSEADTTGNDTGNTGKGGEPEFPGKDTAVESSNTSELASVERYCSEHEVRFYRTSAKSNSGILQIFDDIVQEAAEEEFHAPAPPQISLTQPHHSRCC